MACSTTRTAAQVVTSLGKADTALQPAAIGTTITPAAIGAEPADATILKDSDIGTSVQAYDADTAKLDTDQPWTGTQTFKLFGANAGTLTADAPFTLSQTWNNAAVAFTGLKVDVTNTASASGSNLAEFRVGGVSKFKISSYEGNLIFGGPCFVHANNSINASYMLGYYYMGLGSDKEIGWAPSTSASVTPDLTIGRDAAGVLYQGNGTNPQAFRIYNTYTSGTNYERAEFAWESNRFHIKTAAQTGTDRGITLDAADLILSSLPTTDPVVAGQLWLDGTALKVSAGA